jgi:hypothetical protein
MNRTDDAQHASLFGPASGLVDVGAFLEACVHAAAEGSATSLSRPDKASINGWSDWLQLSNERRAEVEADCRYELSDINDSYNADHRSVDDVSSLVDGTLETVRTAAHIIRLNRATLDAIRSSATSKKRTSRRQPDIVDPEHEHVEVKAMQSKLDAVQLVSWKLDLNSALLMRTPINADYNALSQVVNMISLNAAVVHELTFPPAQVDSWDGQSSRRHSVPDRIQRSYPDSSIPELLHADVSTRDPLLSKCRRHVRGHPLHLERNTTGDQG